MTADRSACLLAENLRETTAIGIRPFDSPDLVPLWDRPPEFLPRHPPGGLHHWHYATVRRELVAVADSLEKQATDRRVALLAHPDLTDAAATDGLHAGVQMLLPGESASAHRHTPAALRVGLEATEMITTVDGDRVLLDTLDVVLNPSGTWHSHFDRGQTGAVWLDIVDLPLVSALGGVLFQPPGQPDEGSLLDPPHGVPAVVRYPWAESRAALDAAEAIHGVRTHHYGNGSVLPTLAVSAHQVEEGSTLRLPRRTAGAVLLVAAGRFGPADDALDRFDVIAMRSWTPLAITSRNGTGVAIVIDTSPAMRALGLYREESQSQSDESHVSWVTGP